MNENENEQFLSRLNMPKGLAEAMQHTLKLKKELQKLENPNLKPSDIYQLLRSYTTQAIRANAVATDSLVIGPRLKLYLNKLSYVKPLLDGDDLKKIGIPAGPLMGELLKALQQARLNGEVKTREDEDKLVQKWPERFGSGYGECGLPFQRVVWRPKRFLQPWKPHPQWSQGYNGQLC